MKTLWALSLTAAAVAGALLYSWTTRVKSPSQAAAPPPAPGPFPAVESQLLPEGRADNAIRHASWTPGMSPTLFATASTTPSTKGKIYVDKAADGKADLSKVGSLIAGRNEIAITSPGFKVLVQGVQSNDKVKVAAQGLVKKAPEPTGPVDANDPANGTELSFPKPEEFIPGIAYKLIPEVERGGSTLSSDSLLIREVVLLRAKTLPQLRKPTVLDGAIVWKETGEPIRLTANTVTLRFLGVTPRNRVAYVLRRTDSQDPATADSREADADGNVEFPLTLDAQAQYTIEAVAYKDGAESERPVRLQLATPTTALDDPSITEVAVGKYAAYQKVNGTVNVYDNTLRLKGRRIRPGAKVRFVVEDKGTTPGFRELATETLGTDSGDWRADVVLPSDLSRDVDHFLLVRAEHDAKHIYSTVEKVRFRIKSEALADRPAITALRNAGASANLPRSEPNPFRSNATQYDVVVSVPNKEKYPDTQVLLFDAFGADPNAVMGSTPLLTAAETTVVRTNPLPDGRRGLVVALARGSSIEQRSDPVELIVRSKGLKVDAVIPPNFGTAAGVQTLTIKFAAENPLLPARAEKRENYALRASGGTGVFDRGTERNLLESTSPRFLIEGPRYDLATNSVILRFDNLPADIYRLEVQGMVSEAENRGLRDVFGNLLEGTEGKPGTDFRVVLGKPQATATAEDGGAMPSVKRGITGESGPMVCFPEYTKPRQLDPGFNPADHVETRVARLYYYRDAHRVAQIINRNVKSYNYAAVAVRRRLADKARDEADVKTDERRHYERAAEQAARDARAVEHELAQAQQDLSDARARVTRTAQEAAQLRRAVEEQQVARPSVEDERRRLVRDDEETLQRLRTQRVEQQQIIKTAEANLETLRLQKIAQERQIFDLDTEINRLQRLLPTTPPPQQPQLRNEIQAREEERAGVRDALARNAFQESQNVEARKVASENIRTLDARLVEARDRLGGTETSTRAVDFWKQRLDEATRAASDATTQQTAAETRIRDLQVKLQTKRAEELQANEKALQGTAKEDRAREEQFRREVAAAHEDPDTYAPADPDSRDPVCQVSISVIGEGLIQLRGPLKGMNVIREMINQIDAPSGQVRVAVHTVQLNGEHGDRMEKIAACIQRYIDHSRFLTMQSAQMLRNAVVTVAAQKAEQAAAECPFDNQQARDQRYLHAFFGRDFINELQAIDSEFLRSGNKLLALHSMDTTSLASALFVFALAKNTTRQEILARFEQMMFTELPAAEHAYFQAGGKKDICCKFQMLSQNARFQSLRGFFSAEIAGPETLNPIQREFIRLAQIFKSRLITELELKQRVMERAVIEDRMGNYLEELQKQKEAEADAEKTLREARLTDINTRDKVSLALNEIVAEIARIRKEAELLGSWSVSTDREMDRIQPARAKDAERRVATVMAERGDVVYYNQLPHFERRTSNLAQKYLTHMQNMRDFLRGFYLSRDQYDKLRSLNDRLQRMLDGKVLPNVAPGAITGGAASHVPALRMDGELINVKDLTSLMREYKEIAEVVLEEARTIEAEFSKLFAGISNKDADRVVVYQGWIRLRQWVIEKIKGELLIRSQEKLARADQAFRDMLMANTKFQSARKAFDESRRSIDHKKLLDMLIDEYHDKYVELLEGTRAHTANIDNYIKSLSTAIDDDFNTQFYNPSFREIRIAAARFWDVNLSKIETTSILTNNRMFAKVSPEATMEFDLPRRDILITEAAKGAKAMMDEYGALMQDPTFLSMMKLRSGQPPSSQAQGAAGGLSTVRNVLPGLPSQTDERVLSQTGPGRREFGSAFEALIPDPAIYKFETGTGYEIRPVIAPDGQAVVFHFQYMYTTNVREPVRADEKHLGRVKRHFIDTDVQLSNYELREVSRYIVGLKASRTSRGVPLLEDIPGVGLLFRPLPQAESALQQNLIYAQSTIFPTLFDLMGLRWAPAVADLDALRLSNEEFVVRARKRDLMNRVFDYSTQKVDDFLRVPPAERRTDLYRSQETIPHVHPNGYSGPGLNLRDSHLQEGYKATDHYPPSRFVPSQSREGAIVPPAGSVPPSHGTSIMPGSPHGSFPPPTILNGHPAPLAPGMPPFSPNGGANHGAFSDPQKAPPPVVTTPMPGGLGVTPPPQSTLPPPRPVPTAPNTYNQVPPAPRSGAAFGQPVRADYSQVIPATYTNPAAPPPPPPETKKQKFLRFFGLSGK